MNYKYGPIDWIKDFSSLILMAIAYAAIWVITKVIELRGRVIWRK